MYNSDLCLKLFSVVAEFGEVHDMSTTDTADYLLRIFACFLNERADEEDIRDVCRNLYTYCAQAVDLQKKIEETKYD